MPLRGESEGENWILCRKEYPAPNVNKKKLDRSLANGREKLEARPRRELLGAAIIDPLLKGGKGVCLERSVADGVLQRRLKEDLWEAGKLCDGLRLTTWPKSEKGLGMIEKLQSEEKRVQSKLIGSEEIWNFLASLAEGTLSPPVTMLLEGRKPAPRGRENNYFFRMPGGVLEVRPADLTARRKTISSGFSGRNVFGSSRRKNQTQAKEIVG